MHMLERLADLLAPDDCLVCHREGALLCSACLPALPPPPSRCFGCYQAVKGVSCEPCLKAAQLSSLQSATHYEGISTQLVAALKFNGNQSAAGIMARVMAPLLTESSTLLVHMPATTAHVRERGYDQSALITRWLSRITGLPRKDVLRRSGSHHQLGADRAQRTRQLTTALSVPRPSKIKGQDIILIDDVLTTGSSISVATRVLLQSGANSVKAAVFAQSIQN